MVEKIFDLFFTFLFPLDVQVSSNPSRLCIFKKEENEIQLTIPLLGSFVRIEKNLKVTLFSSDASVYIFEVPKDHEFVAFSSILSRLSQESTLKEISSAPHKKQHGSLEIIEMVEFISNENGNQFCADWYFFVLSSNLGSGVTNCDRCQIIIYN